MRRSGRSGGQKLLQGTPTRASTALLLLINGVAKTSLPVFVFLGRGFVKVTYILPVILFYFLKLINRKVEGFIPLLSLPSFFITFIRSQSQIPIWYALRVDLLTSKTHYLGSYEVSYISVLFSLSPFPLPLVFFFFLPDRESRELLLV